MKNFINKLFGFSKNEHHVFNENASSLIGNEEKINEIFVHIQKAVELDEDFGNILSSAFQQLSELFDSKLNKVIALKLAKEIYNE